MKSSRTSSWNSVGVLDSQLHIEPTNLQRPLQTLDGIKLEKWGDDKINKEAPLPLWSAPSFDPKDTLDETTPPIPLLTRVDLVGFGGTRFDGTKMLDHAEQDGLGLNNSSAVWPAMLSPGQDMSGRDLCELWFVSEEMEDIHALVASARLAFWSGVWLAIYVMTVACFLLVFWFGV